MSPPSLDYDSIALPSSSSSSSSSFSKVAFLFQSTYHDLEIRSEVHDVLQGMLWDVELTSHLHEQLEQEDQQSQWADLLQHQRQELEQAKLQSSRSQQTHQQWADQLVKELWLFSQDYGRFLEKQHHTTQSLQRELEETKEQLAAALEAKGDAARHSPAVAAPPVSLVAPEIQTVPSREEETPLAAVTAAAALLSTTASSDSKEATATAMTATPPTSNEVAKVTPPQPAVVSLMTASEEEAEQTDGIPPLPTSLAAPTATTSTTAPPTLVGLEIELLMHIFGFLDALDILNTAQVNIAMYSKVDSLFGLGANSSGRNEMGGESRLGAPPAAATPASSATATASAATTQPSGVDAKPSSTADPSTAAASQRATTTPTKANASPETLSLSSSSSLLLGGGKGLFSLLSSSSSAAAAAAKSHKPSGSSSSFPLGILSSSSSSSVPTPAAQQTPSLQLQQPDRQHQQPWTRSMADSLAKKLTDAEMSAIISMTVKLRQRNQDVEQLRLEREELLGKVQGMEAIRKFLLDKIRQVELTLTKTRDDTVRVTQQSASDQEVIAFLDARVQELEREVQSLTQAKQQLQDEANQSHSQLSQKVSVLSDLLQFERERYRDHDREAKATKKVLVKEVKQCRAQIVALQAQRDGCMEENEKLRNAVLSMNVTGGTNNNNNSAT